MPLTVDSVVHGPGAKLPARAMMLALSEELFNHLRDAVKTQRSHPTTNGNHPPPPPVELEFTRSQSATEKVGITCLHPTRDRHHTRLDGFLYPSCLLSLLLSSHQARYTSAVNHLGSPGFPSAYLTSTHNHMLRMIPKSQTLSDFTRSFHKA